MQATCACALSRVTMHRKDQQCASSGICNPPNMLRTVGTPSMLSLPTHCTLQLDET